MKSHNKFGESSPLTVLGDSAKVFLFTYITKGIRSVNGAQALSLASMLATFTPE